MITFALILLLAASMWQIGATCRLTRKVKQIMATQQELATKLNSIGDELDKAFKEITDAVQALKDALANAGNSTPEVDAAVARLDTAAQALDNINPDAPTP